MEVKKTEKQKMINGELYCADDPELIRDRARATALFTRYNRTRSRQTGKRRKILDQLFGTAGRNICVTPPFYCDYGYNISVGDNFYSNFGCVFLDVCKISIGENVLIGPNVHLYSATHPVEPESRRKMLEMGKPIIIGNNVWIGGGTIVCPGVSIGDDSVIGAGSVVTKDIPPGTLAAGNPCRMIRPVVK